MKKFTSNAQKVGEIGENVACKYLENKGFSILDRNYTKKWGELDIVAQKDGKVYFIEVKSRSTNLSSDLLEKGGGVLRPEEGMHVWKMKRLSRIIRTYIISKKMGDTPWQLDLYNVFLDMTKRTARVKVIENVIL